MTSPGIRTRNTPVKVGRPDYSATGIDFHFQLKFQNLKSFYSSSLQFNNYSHYICKLSVLTPQLFPLDKK